jgi:hypothetical protein
MLIAVACGVSFASLLPFERTLSGSATENFEIGLLVAICAVTCAIEFWCLLSIVRICKARMLGQRLISWIALRWIGRGVRGLTRAIKSGFDGRNPIAKTVILLAMFWFVMTLVAVALFKQSYYSYSAQMLCILMFFAVPILVLYIAVKWVKHYGELKRGVEEIAGGNLSYKIPVKKAPRASSKTCRLWSTRSAARRSWLCETN